MASEGRAFLAEDSVRPKPGQGPRLEGNLRTEVPHHRGRGREMRLEEQAGVWLLSVSQGATLDFTLIDGAITGVF